MNLWNNGKLVRSYFLRNSKNFESAYTIIADEMHLTLAEINARLPEDLSKIVIAYVKSVARDWNSVAEAGEYETCLNMPEGLFGEGIASACLGGHMEIVKLMIVRGAKYFEFGLYAGCSVGHMEIVRLMISNGAKKFNFGFFGACYGGHKEIAEYMISKGANNIYECFRGACSRGKIEIVRLMISHGADNWNMGLAIACKNGYKELIALMISCGASHCSSCQRSVDRHRE